MYRNIFIDLLSVSHVTDFYHYVAIPLLRPFSCSNQRETLLIPLLRGSCMYIYLICLFSCSAPIQPMHTVRQPCTIKSLQMSFCKCTVKKHIPMQFCKCTAKTFQHMPQPTHNQSSLCQIPII